MAFGLLAAASLRDFQSLFGHVPENTIDLFVPENGFISINPPLTSRRLGSHSTHTTHPQFIAGFKKYGTTLVLTQESLIRTNLKQKERCA